MRKNNCMDISSGEIRTWLRRGNMKRETESLLTVINNDKLQLSSINYSNQIRIIFKRICLTHR